MSRIVVLHARVVGFSRMLTSVQTVIVSATLLKILHCIVHVQVLPGLNDRTGDLQSTCKILLVQ